MTRWERLLREAAHGLLVGCLMLGQAPNASASDVYTDRDAFLTHISVGYYEENFASVPTGEVDAPLPFSGGGFSYSVFSQAGGSGLYNEPGTVSTYNQVDQIVVTFTTPVMAVGGNFWASDFNFAPTGTSVAVTLSDGTVETMPVSDETTFLGFVAGAPITSLTIDAPDASGDSNFPTLTDLIVGSPSDAPPGEFSYLHSFSFADGTYPQGGVVQGSDGDLYGTTSIDSSGQNNGSVFKLTLSGTLTTLHSLASDGSEGRGLFASLVQGSDGDFYGTAPIGGASNRGTVFKVTSSGAFTVLHAFLGGSGEGGFPYGALVQGSDGNFYGTTANGDGAGSDYGTVFKITPSGTLTTLYAFDSAHGANPYAGLMQGSDGNFYGTTTAGGANGAGTVFEITSSGVLTTLYSFDSTDGASPYAALVQGGDGNFYGTCSAGGANGVGTVFKITSFGALTTLYSFESTNGANPYAALALGGDGSFYGTTYAGGSSGAGTLFRITPTGSLTVLYSAPDFVNPQAGVLQGSDGNLYGTTYQGGADGFGGVFVYGATALPPPSAPVISAIPGNASVTLSWSAVSGATSYALYQGTTAGGEGTAPIASGIAGTSYTVSGLTNGTTYYFTLTATGSGGTSTPSNEASATPVVLPTFSYFYSFYYDSGSGTAPYGAAPYAGLLIGSDGNFYGTTNAGGANGGGTVFQLTPTGVLTTLHDFAGGSEGNAPYAGVVQGSDGAFYGTTYGGASNPGCTNCGSVFKVTSSGVFTTLHAFAYASDGAYPMGGVVQGGDGNFYGTTSGGGTHGTGTVFKLTSSGTFTVLHVFTGADGEGGYPYAGLVLGRNGDLYGTTHGGGTNDFGTVFKITPTGALTTLYSFDSTNGAHPMAPLVQGNDDNFYGTTFDGGSVNFGTVFKITPAGVLTSLHAFLGGNSDGKYPYYGGLLQGGDGNFYGTTINGGSHNSGVLFKFAPTGTFTLLHAFDSGSTPDSGVVQGADGNLYGTTQAAGTSSRGSVYVYNMVLPPIAPALSATPANGAVGLSWTASSGATSYNVYMGTSPGGESSVPVASGVTGESYTVSGLANGTTYYFTLTATGSTGSSVASNEVSATPTSAAPAAPVPTAVPGDGFVSLSWSVVSGATSYEVYMGTAPGGEGASPVASVSGTGYTASGLTNGTTYYFTLTATGPGGTSAPSIEISATPAPPAAPAAPVISATPGNNSVTLSWQPVSGATSYSVYLGTSPGGEESTPVITITAAGGTLSQLPDGRWLFNGTTYYFEVTANGDGGISPRSNEVSVTPATPPPTTNADYVYTQGDVFGQDNPRSALVLGRDGNYYGITSYGGSHGAGTFYRLTPDGVKTVLYNFGGYCQPNDTLCRDGLPLSGWLTQDADGNFYGVESGVTGFGTASATNFGWVYKMTPDGVMTHIYEDLTGSALPGDGVVLGQDGNFYGITNLADQYGGPTPLLGGGIYQLTPSGQYSIVFDWATFAEHVNSDTRPGGKLTEAYGYWWASIPADGFGGDSGILRLDFNAGEALVIPCIAGNGFGTATAGVCANPGHLVPGPDDTLYAVCTGCNWLELQLPPNGEFVDLFPGGVFKVTVDGTVTLVHGFALDGNGVWPYEDLVRASDGNFYGSTMATFLSDATTTNEAHIYRVSPNGDFSNVVDDLALAPGVAMMQGSDGKLRGVNQSSAFALWNSGLLSSYLASPIVAQDFEPATIPQGEVSTLTITLGNSGSSAAILSEPLIDRLPDSVTVAQVPNPSTTCTHGSVVADAGSNTITLATSSQIPGGTCTVTVSVTGGAAGSHINTIPAWAVQTNLGGNVEPALAALTVTPVADAIFADGFDG